ncbi:MAG: Holliday junction resolvase RuvX [Candidatus Kapabacteria bacterium]|nr:Holliday junction resolvase RuvX [Ignavibacteriota bacterium]MCW5884199.1 Holliday junction resolvase RuvX [Candidatus Kapabacteria bacterium]
MTNLKEHLSGKRLAGIDYGTKRIGLAVCDELHISVKPVTTISTAKKNYIDEICNILASERVEAVVIGKPDTYDGKKIDFHEKIDSFGNEIQKKFHADVYYTDESFSSISAASFMVSYGIKKKDRAAKGTIDKYAAAIILQQFLNELE